MDTEPLRRCRGIPLGDGNHTGCAYGDGSLAPLTGPRDCPICHGSGVEGVIGTIIPHSSSGDPECCGCLNGIMRGDQADIVCNECNAVVRTVPASNLQQALDEMELTLDSATGLCSNCGAVNIRPGFSKLMAFTCRQCGQLNRLSDNPSIDQFFGEA